MLFGGTLVKNLLTGLVLIDPGEDLVHDAVRLVEVNRDRIGLLVTVEVAEKFGA